MKKQFNKKRQNSQGLKQGRQHIVGSQKYFTRRICNIQYIQ